MAPRLDPHPALIKLLPTLLTVAACAIGATARAQGIPQDGFPSWQERTLWVFVNRDRADPQTALAPCIDGGGCPDSECYEVPLPPLAYDPRLGHSARLQPTILAENNVTLMHPSPCLLNPDIGKTYPDECDGGTDCVCQTPVQCSNPPDTDPQQCACSEDTSDTTKFEDWATRIQLFAPGSIAYAENIAAGQPDPMSVESQWLNEPCPCCAAFACVSLECPGGTGLTNGHRTNLMSTAVNSIGLGAVAAPASDCYGSPDSYYWGQDFAFFYNVGIQKLVAGSHFPQSGTTTCAADGGNCSVAITFYANWYDPVAGAPSKAAVVINSESHAMTLDRGDGGNATYTYAATLPAGGCQPYTFAFKDSSGFALTLPVSGNYLAGDTCKADFSSPGGCSTGAGEPWLGGLLLAAAALRRRAKPRGACNGDRKLTKWP